MARNTNDGVRKFDASAPAPSGQKIESAPVRKWESGMEVEGAFGGLKSIVTQFGAGELCEIHYSNGKRETFGAPIRLANLLRNVAYGSTVTIRCYGKRPCPSGMEWMFEVFGTTVTPQDGDSGEEIGSDR